MSFISVGTTNGLPIQLFYKDWGKGQPVVFSHGWPLSSDAFEDQMLYLSQKGLRVIAHDRRGHGRSSQPGNGNEMNTYADDLAKIIDSLDLRDAVLVGHSTGGGEVARYIGRHGTKRLSKAVLIGAVPPIMLKTPSNPDGLELSIFDEIRAKVIKDKSQYFKELSELFYGANRIGSHVSQGLKDSFWLISMQGGLKNIYDCIKAFSETDFSADLSKFDIPTLLIHGDDDQIVPINNSAEKAVKLINNATLKIYHGGSHGICSTHKQQINQDLFNFIAS